MSYSVSRLILISLVCALTGCGLTHRVDNPHNDVLVFGTGTKFAIDVSAPVQNGGIPEFTVGYKRLEAVWMPLQTSGAMNTDPTEAAEEFIQRLTDCIGSPELGTAVPDADKRADFCLTAVSSATKYMSISKGIDPTKGGSQLEMDSYSVFASLGAKGSLGINQAGGSLAQFFATGVAAQRLGANASIGMVLNAKAADAEAKKAEAKTEVSKEVQALIKAGVDPEKAVEMARGTEITKEKLVGDVGRAMSCLKERGGSLPVGSLGDNAKAIIGIRANEALLESQLRDDGPALREILALCDS
jgi:hypothetical protein